MGESEGRDGRDALAHVYVSNDGEIIARLRLSAAEAARVCGVTPRQLIYWTKKGLVRPSADGAEDYDVFALEKVIRIRQALTQGHSLERAAQLVDRDLSTLSTEVSCLAALDGQDLEAELRNRLERLEMKVAELRHTLPASLTLSRLRRAVAVLARLESQGALQAPSPSDDGAKAMTARLGRAVEELEMLLKEAEPAPIG